jgi:hypothetical protein
MTYLDVALEPSLQEDLQTQIKDLLGEKTAADDEKIVKKKKEKKPKGEVRTFSMPLLLPVRLCC